jgi:hypothetical protein
VTETEPASVAARLLREAIMAGRLPEAPSPESLARIASIVRSVFIAEPAVSREDHHISATNAARETEEQKRNARAAATS